MSNIINPHKIASDVDDYSKQLIALLPHLGNLFDRNTSSLQLCGDTVRRIIENMLQATPLSVEEYSSTLKSVDIYVNKNISITEFFQSVTSKGGFIEYSKIPKMTTRTMGSCGRYGCSNCDRGVEFTDNIDLLGESKILEGHYFVYAVFGDSFIKYNIYYNVKYISYFTASNAVYPSLSNNYVKDTNICAIMDIADRRIVPCNYNGQFRTALFDSEKLYRDGYRFDNEGHVQKLFTAAILSKEKNYYIGDTNEPSDIKSRKSNLIIPSKHVVTVLTSELIRSHSGIIEMIDTHPLPFRKWNLPESGKGQGITLDTVTVYKGVCVRVYSQKNPSTNDIFNRNYKQKIVMLELEVPAFTRFNRDLDSCFLKFRFEKAVVKGVYAYPMRRMDQNEIVVYSQYDSGFTYTVGETVEPSSIYNTSDEACKSGIHAFLDTSTVWSYFRDSAKLIYYKQKEVHVSVLTDGDKE